METESVINKVNTSASNLPQSSDSANIITIYVQRVIREVIQDGSGTVTNLRSYQAPSAGIRLKPSGGLTASHLSELLGAQQIPQSPILGQQIALQINRLLATQDSLREPLFVTVNAKFVIKKCIVSKGALGKVLQRLVEQQGSPTNSMLKGKEIQTCSICIEDLSKNVVRIPPCLHTFHRDCLFDWLVRHNSCPLCRTVPYD